MLGENMLLKRLGLNSICELSHQTFLHTQKAGKTLPWALSTHKNIRVFKKLPLFVSSNRRRGYNMLGPLLRPEHGITTNFDYGLCPHYNFCKLIKA